MTRKMTPSRQVTFLELMERERERCPLSVACLLPDPCCQLLSFHAFKQILWWYQVAWPSRDCTVGRQREGLWL